MMMKEEIIKKIKSEIKRNDESWGFSTFVEIFSLMLGFVFLIVILWYVIFKGFPEELLVTGGLFTIVSVLFFIGFYIIIVVNEKLRMTEIMLKDAIWILNHWVVFGEDISLRGDFSKYNRWTRYKPAIMYLKDHHRLVNWGER